MAEYRDILWRFLGDSSDLSAATAKADRDLTGVEKSTAKAQAGFGKLQGALAAAGIAFGAAEVGKFAWEAANLAEAADKTAQAFDTTFGPAAVQLGTVLEEQRLLMGLSTQEFQAALIPIGQLAQAMDLDRDAAAQFGEELFKVAGDLAAFDGDLSDTEDALNAVQGALKGEFDPLEQFGVKLKQSDINMEALRQTGKETTAELTNQEIALATLSLVMAQATDETGSLIAMQGSLQGSTNQLTAEFTDLKTELGQALLPTLIDYGQGLLTALDASKLAADGTQSLTDRLKGAWTAYVELMKITPVTGQIIGFFTDRIREATAASGALIDKVADLVAWIKRIPSTLPNPFRNFRVPNLSMPSWVPGFATGGTVSGPRGRAQLAVVHGGETITPPGVGSSGGAGGTVIVNFNGVVTDPLGVAQQIQELIELGNRASGTLD